MKNTILKISTWIAAVVAIVVLAIHFYKIADVPYGFHVDEYAHAVTAKCMATEGVDAQNRRYPIFGDLNYGIPSPPTHMYTAALWGKAFGFTVPSMRLLTVCVFLIGVLGLLLLGQLLYGWRMAWWVFLVAAISPWAWPLSRVGYGSFFAASLIIWALFFFLQKPKIYRWIISGILFAGAMYAYPPVRLQVPLMMVPLLIFAHARAKGLGHSLKGSAMLSHSAAFLFPFVLVLLPLAVKTFSGEIQQRFNDISILNLTYLHSVGKTNSPFDILSVFLYNLSLHVSPEFLVISGDPSYVHSTRHFGVLSWMDVAALASALVFLFLLVFPRYRNNNPWDAHGAFICFCIINIVIGFIPVGLTNSELPNSLRICGAWPFVCLFSGFFIWQTVERWWVISLPAILGAVLFSVMFVRVYFGVFPQEAKGMFGFWTVEQAKALRTEEDWVKFMLYYRYEDYHVRYYLMNNHSKGCKESKQMWNNLRIYLQSKGTY